MSNVILLRCKQRGEAMSRLQKLYEKVRNNPKTVRFEELEKILLVAGFVKKQSGKGTSHYFYVKDGKALSVPYKRPYILEIYVKKALELVGDCFDDE